MSEEIAEADPTSPVSPDRLWTPWRMRYVGGGDREPGCVFCARQAGTDDRANLILHRGDHSFVIMNLYPYNTGHVMLVPNEHVASPESAPPAAMSEMATRRGPLLRAARRALGCHGFNLGLNVGAEAGAGIAEHMHEHVVPRWLGDANFMPILANTMVLPELIPVTYAKLRAEIGREMSETATVQAIVLDTAGEAVLVSGAGPLLTAPLRPEEAAWRTAAARAAQAAGAPVQLTGWAGGDARDPALILAFRVDPAAGRGGNEGSWRPVAPAITDADGDIIVRAANTVVALADS